MFFYRKSPFETNEKGKIKISLNELLSAFSILSLEEGSGKARLLFDLFAKTSELGVKCADKDILKQILEKQCRFRHFYADSLLKRTKWFPLPAYEKLSEEDMAESILISAGKPKDSGEINVEEFLKAFDGIKNRKWYQNKSPEAWYLDNKNMQ